MRFWGKRKNRHVQVWQKPPVTTHVIRITKESEQVYTAEILEVNGYFDENNIIRQYKSEKDCRLALVGLRNAFQNGTWRVDVIEEKKEVEAS